MSRLDLTLDPKRSETRRIEVITGAGGRRRWSDEEKARAVDESFAPGAVVSQAARRHAATPQQLFTRRREAQRKAAEVPPPFVPAIVKGSAAAERTPATAPKARTSAAPVMEIEIGDAHVWVWRDADIGLATAIVRALQTASRVR